MRTERNNGTELLSFCSLRALKHVGGDLARGRNRRLRTALGHCELMRRGGDGQDAPASAGGVDSIMPGWQGERLTPSPFLYPPRRV